MSTIKDDPTPALARRLRIEREARSWSLSDLAERSGVSKAMISKIERGEASPTAALLGRLSGAFGLTLSSLLVRAERSEERLLRAGDQPLWRDPDTGYLRRQLSAPSDVPIELIEVTLPAGAKVDYPASAYMFIRQMIWMLEGRLRFSEGPLSHDLAAGDCLTLGPPSDCQFETGDTPCRYLVAILRR
jgi:transcriptional regulator with XRE-family HTH domain